MSIDLSKSLEELENDKWGEPEFKSHLITECHRLRKIPLKEFTVENLRILIGQNIGLKYLVPLALEILEKCPFTEGDMYKGDLLVSVAKIDPNFWESNPELNNRFVEIKQEVEILNNTINEEIMPILSKFNYR